MLLWQKRQWRNCYLRALSSEQFPRILSHLTLNDVQHVITFFWFMIIDDATLPNQDSFPNLVNSMSLSPMVMVSGQFIRITLHRLELRESMLGAEECFDDWETEYAFGWVNQLNTKNTAGDTCGVLLLRRYASKIIWCGWNLCFAQRFVQQGKARSS